MGKRILLTKGVEYAGQLGCFAELQRKTATQMLTLTSGSPWLGGGDGKKSELSVDVQERYCYHYAFPILFKGSVGAKREAQHKHHQIRVVPGVS